MSQPISPNVYPLSLLNSLGISVLANDDEVEKPHLPTELGNYLDSIIRKGDQESLEQTTPQILAAVTRLMNDNVVVALNALVANDLVHRSTGSLILQEFEEQSVEETSSIQVSHYHERQLRPLNNLIKEIGIKGSDNPLDGFSIENRDVFNQFLDRLVKKLKEENLELSDKQREILSDVILYDAIDNLGRSLEGKRILASEGIKIGTTLNRMQDLGVTELETKRGKIFIETIKEGYDSFRAANNSSAKEQNREEAEKKIDNLLKTLEFMMGPEID